MAGFFSEPELLHTFRASFETNCSIPARYQRIIALSFRQGLPLGRVASAKEPKVVAVVDDDESVREALLALLETAGSRLARSYPPNGPNL